MEDKSSIETSQRQFGDKAGNAIKVQMESLMPDLSKIRSPRRLRKWFLYMCDYLALKPFQIQRQNDYFYWL
jgi:hypothetical protein